MQSYNSISRCIVKRIEGVLCIFICLFLGKALTMEPWLTWNSLHPSPSAGTKGAHHVPLERAPPELDFTLFIAYSQQLKCGTT